MVRNHSTAQVLAGLGTVAGGLGITWRSVATSLGRMSLDLGKPLWGAIIDAMTGNRLTPPPQRDYVPEILRPQGRWRRAWRELSTPDPEAPRGAPAKRNDGVPAPAARPEQVGTDAVVTEIVPVSQDGGEDEAAG